MSHLFICVSIYYFLMECTSCFCYPGTLYLIRFCVHWREHGSNIFRMGRGIIDAASVGAVGSIAIVAHISASVIAFFSLLDFVNATLQWFGDRVGLSPPDYPPLSFEVSTYFSHKKRMSLSQLCLLVRYLTLRARIHRIS